MTTYEVTLFALECFYCKGKLQCTCCVVCFGQLLGRLSVVFKQTAVSCVQLHQPAGLNILSAAARCHINQDASAPTERKGLENPGKKGWWNSCCHCLFAGLHFSANLINSPARAVEFVITAIIMVMGHDETAGRQAVAHWIGRAINCIDRLIYGQQPCASRPRPPPNLALKCRDVRGPPTHGLTYVQVFPFPLSHPLTLPTVFPIFSAFPAFPG